MRGYRNTGGPPPSESEGSLDTVFATDSWTERDRRLGGSEGAQKEPRKPLDELVPLH